MTLLTWQSPSVGHSTFFLQFQFSFRSRGFHMTFLLCPLKIFDILFMLLQLTLTVLWLNILWSLWLLGRCFVTNWRNVSRTFVEMDLLKGGFNHVMFCICVFDFSDLLLVYFQSTLSLNFFSAFSCSTFAVLNISWSEEFFDSL